MFIILVINILHETNRIKAVIMLSIIYLQHRKYITYHNELQILKINH